jgi:peptidyl-prolyl cis-trans isomerase C
MRARTCVLHSLASAAALLVVASAAPAQIFSKPAKPAAVVDGTPITFAEIEAILKQAPPSPTPLTEAQRRQMQMDAIAMLADDILMQNFLRKSGPKVDPAEVNKRVAQLADSQKKMGKTLEDFYKEAGQSEAQLRANIVTKLQWDAYVQAHLTEADIKKYYEDYKDYFDRVSVRASHIVLRAGPNASEKERQEIRAKLQTLRQEIVGGKLDFAEAAKKYSQCISAKDGGDIGYFPRKLAVDEAFARAAFALKPGDISDVVQSEYGLHLIKVTDRKAGQPSDYSKVKETVRELCMEDMWLALLAEQRKTAHVEVNLP